MGTRSFARLRRLSQAACAAGFVLLIFLPLADQLLRPASARDPRREFRAPAPRPRLTLEADELATFPERFEAWHLDTFGLRDRLLRWHNILRWYGLHTAPSPRLVLGAQGWIFPTGNSALEDHRGLVPMHHDELEQWRRFLERRRDWLASRGAEFLFVIAPNKNQLYPDLLPAHFAPIGPTRLDQLVAHLREHSDLAVLDLRAALRDERRHDRGQDWTYYPLGTHWTDRGAYAGYAALLGQLATRLPAIAALPREAFDVRLEPDPGDSWAGRLYMGDLLDQQNLAWSVREPRAQLVDSGDRGLVQRYELPDSKSLPAGLFVHDSFGEPMRPWLAEHFSRLDCIWGGFDAELVERVRPGVVVQLYCEYTLVSLVPQLTPLEAEGHTLARFEEAQEVLWRLPDPPDLAGLRSDSQLSLVEGLLRLERARSQELLYLPELDYPPDRTLLLLVQVDAPRPGMLEAYYSTAEQPGYERRRAVRVRLDRGITTNVLVLPPRELAGSLALRIGSDPASYTVRRIEIRVAAR